MMDANHNVYVALLRCNTRKIGGRTTKIMDAVKVACIKTPT